MDKERIEVEKARIRQAYHGGLQWGHESDVKAKELYAAQQALAWALDPTVARSPFEMIMDGPLTSGESVHPSATSLTA